MNRRIATAILKDNLTGRTITVPAHKVAKERITATDIAKHGSLAAAREAKWGASS